MSITTKKTEEKIFFEQRYGADNIATWRKQHGSIFGYKTSDGKSCVLRCADLMTLDACRSVSGGSSIKFDIALLENCWIDGDKELMQEDKYKMGLFDWLGHIIKKVDGELGEL